MSMNGMKERTNQWRLLNDSDHCLQAVWEAATGAFQIKMVHLLFWITDPWWKTKQNREKVTWGFFSSYINISVQVFLIAVHCFLFLHQNVFGDQGWQCCTSYSMSFLEQGFCLFVYFSFHWFFMKLCRFLTST